MALVRRSEDSLQHESRYVWTESFPKKKEFVFRGGAYHLAVAQPVSKISVSSGIASIDEEDEEASSTTKVVLAEQ